jgi:hypothetical protein
MSNTLELTLIREVVVKVEYTCTKAYKGYRNSLGVPEEPDEDADVEILSVLDEDGKEIKTTPDEDDIIHQACLDND